jgi:hypothetical protein
LTEDEFAQLTGMSLGWLIFARNYHTNGDRPPAEEIDGKIRYRRRDFRKWLESRQKFHEAKIAERREFYEKQKLERKAFREETADRRRTEASKSASGGGETKEERKEKTAAL